MIHEFQKNDKFEWIPPPPLGFKTQFFHFSAQRGKKTIQIFGRQYSYLMNAANDYDQTDLSFLRKGGEPAAHKTNGFLRTLRREQMHRFIPKLIHRHKLLLFAKDPVISAQLNPWPLRLESKTSSVMTQTYKRDAQNDGSHQFSEERKPRASWEITQIKETRGSSSH